MFQGNFSIGKQMKKRKKKEGVEENKPGMMKVEDGVY